MSFFTAICFLIICCLKVLAVDSFTSTKTYDSSEEPCKWPNPPLNGVNFKRCGSHFCPEREGSLKPLGFVKFTECQKGHFMAQGEKEAFCYGGVWTQDEYKCAACGKSQLNELTLIHNGTKAKRGDFPWMAGLFLRNDSNQWELKCGASLISDHLVLTAAHCVKLFNATFIKPENIQVGLGMLQTDFYSAENNAEFKKVREVIVPQRYVGATRNYDLDIALLDLETPVTVGPNIMPACIDWKDKTPLDNKEGYLAGYRGMGEGVLSDVLKWSRQRYVEYSNCIEKIPSQIRRLLTPDKFCVISVNGARADYGVSGGGLTIVKDDVHYVYGVDSVRITKYNDGEDIVLFTNVLEYKEWILEHWKRLNHLHGKQTGFNRKAESAELHVET